MKPACVLALSTAVLCAVPLLAQEPLVTGSEGVPAPKRTRFVQPVYPQEAIAQGLRGIVILDLLIDTRGRVSSVAVTRSIPGLDEAAIAAAKQWEFEPVRVAGKLVQVRHTVPVTFTLMLPQLAREPGIPELRQGASPIFPQGASGGGSAAAEVTLEADGRIAASRVVSGAEPWGGALLAALATWRFTPPPEDVSVSFRVEAAFVAARSSEPRRVELTAKGLQRGELAAATPAAAPEPTKSATATPTAPAPARVASPTAATPAQSLPTQAAPAQAAPTQATPAPAAPTPTPQTPAPQAPAPKPTASGTPKGGDTPASAPGATAPAAPQPRPSTAQTTPAAPTTVPPPAAPAVEVITAPPPPLPPENGVSAVRDVTLAPGVPDLTRGRRPVAPPLARMGGATGTVEVAFSVGAAGNTMVQGVNGPDLLKKAAEQAVVSWVFRRTRADRAYLTAVFDYAADKTTAVIRPQPAAPGGAAPGGAPASHAESPATSASAPTAAPTVTSPTATPPHP